MEEKRLGTCMLCEASCGLVLTLGNGDDGVHKVLRVEGDRDDTFSRGYVCPKATAIDDVRLDPDRVTEPLRRTKSGEFAPISWNEALDESAERLAAIFDRHGPHAVATYTGNPLVHSYGGILGSVLLSQGIGSYSRFSATSADQLPQMLASYQVLGHQALLPVPDLERTNHLLIVGGNPVVSNGSIMTAPGMKRRLEEIRARGGKVVVIDPRRTETARVADEHHFVVPGSDALLLLAMIDTIFSESLGKASRVGQKIVGLEELGRAASRFSAERVEHAVGISKDTIRRLAREHAKADGAACYARMGACTQEFGSLTSWLAIALDVVTGNLDRPGGKMFPTPAVDLAKLASRLGMRGSFARFKSRVRGLPEFGGELPVATLAEEITTEGKKRIRGFVTMAGNPVSSAPNGAALDLALPKLDFMVSVDLYRNETTRHADIILPPVFGLERDHYDMVLYAFAVRNVARYTEAVFPPRGSAREDFDILTDLALRTLQKRKGFGHLAQKATLTAARALGSRRIVDLLLRTGPHKLSVKSLLSTPHGRDLGALEPRLSELLEGRAIQAAPAVFVADLARLDAKLSEATTSKREGELLLIGRRSLRSNNSWMHNLTRLTRGKPVCTLLMHPDDASDRAMRSGDTVRLRSKKGEVTVPLEVSDEIARGVVSLPHGWGQQKADLRIAKGHVGASVNDVTDESFLDALSGTAAFNGVKVEVTA